MVPGAIGSRRLASSAFGAGGATGASSLMSMDATGLGSTGGVGGVGSTGGVGPAVGALGLLPPRNLLIRAPRPLPGPASTNAAAATTISVPMVSATGATALVFLTFIVSLVFCLGCTDPSFTFSVIGCFWPL